MTDEILRLFAKKIRLERLNLNLSQEELASRAGLHRTYIGMIERSEKNISLKNIQRLAKALNKSVADIMRIDK